MKKLSLWLLLCITVMAHGGALAQVPTTELAATLEVLEAGVEVLRANTSNWLPVRLEAIVGVGDMIRTDASGRARITFFADGTDTEVLPNTLYRIVQFEGDATRFTLQGEVMLGQTLQRLGRLLDAQSSYTIRTPGMTLVARGTEFRIRVEESQRAAMLVLTGAVAAQNPQSQADVPNGFGVRADADAPLSDVVRASTFEQLDAALDGCPITLSVPDDVSLNVRIAPNRTADLLGYISAESITQAYGITATTQWYRIPYADDFAWILSTSAQIGACAGLRQFPDDWESQSDPAPETTPPAP